jgi:TolB-like protein/tetratricopeptide (TPR) repeat protein
VIRGSAALRSGLLLLAALLLPGMAGATTLAVTWFDTNTADERLAPLGRGLASMLITDLSPLEALTVVERARMSEVLAEMEFQKSPYVDKSTAVQVGKGLGAEWVLTGAVSALEATMRLDARLVEVGTGRVLETESVTGPTAEFFLLEKELATAILDKLQVRTTSRESAQMGRVATESFDAFVAWSQGLAALDRGAMEEARASLEEALTLDDRFGLATSMLDELRDTLKSLDARRAEASDEQAAAILRRIAQLQAAGGPYTPLETELVPISTVAAGPVNARVTVAIAGAVLDLGLPEELRLGGPQGVYSLNEWAMYAYTMAQQWLGRRSDFITYGNAFLERYPGSVMAPAFSSGLQRLLTLMKEEEEGRAEIPRIRVEATGTALKIRCTSERDPERRLAACRAWFRDSDAAGIALDGDAEEMWARAAAHAGDVAEIEQVWARAKAREQYGEAAEDIARMLERARREAKTADEAVAKLEAAKDAAAVARAAGALANAGRVAQVFAAMDDGYRRFGEVDDLFSADIGFSVMFGDRARAEATLARWEAAAGHSEKVAVDASTARRVLTWDEDTRYVREADALALLQLAIGYLKIGQRKQAADAYVELAERYPDFSSYEAPLALSTAANMYYQAWEMDASRAIYLRLLDRHPDSPSAQAAHQMLSLLPE